MNHLPYFKFFSMALFLICSAILSSQLSHAQNLSFSTDTDWTFTASGALPVFLVTSEHEGFDAEGEDQFASRVMSGFNPGNITFSITAPEMNGISVSGMFQINHHLQGPSIQNEGLFEGRIADIVISGDFGTFNLGKGFGVFNSIAIGDVGSAAGVGRFSGPDAANATLGRIGTGYSYANFNPRASYTTPDIGGFKAQVGLINPEKPGGFSTQIETWLPRFEGQVDYIIDVDEAIVQLWAGGMYQNVNVTAIDFDYDITGWDTGARLSAAGFTVTGAYSQTQSVGADGLIGLSLSTSGLDEANVKATQWYTEAAYSTGQATFGLSYGEGAQDEQTSQVGAAPDITNTLLMGFGRYRVTDQLTLLLEIQSFTSDAQSNYNALIFGSMFAF